MHIGVTRIITNMFGFNTAPRRRRNNLTRLRLNITETDFLFFFRLGQMRMIQPCKFTQSLPCLNSNFTVCFRGKRQDNFRCINIGFDLRKTVTLAIKLLKEFNLIISVPTNAFTTITQFIQKWAKRCETVIGRGIITLHHFHGWGSFTRNKITFAFAPFLHIILRQLTRRIMLNWCKDDLFLNTQITWCKFREFLRKSLINIPV